MSATDDEPTIGAGMRLFAVDVRVRDAVILVDCDSVKELMRDAAIEGGATILGEEFVVFPNRAFTGVFVLAQSHLSVHTWPEMRLANIDLLTYGTLDGHAILDRIVVGLGAVAVNTSCLWRGVPQPPAA